MQSAALHVNIEIYYSFFNSHLERLPVDHVLLELTAHLLDPLPAHPVRQDTIRYVKRFN